jgi:hypothetical protein
MKQCPIQIVEEDPSKGGLKYGRWIALSRDIDHENNMYHNVSEYHPKISGYKTLLDKGFFGRLFHGRNPTPISTWDIIRNPTMEELREISDAAKKIGIKINLKTGEYIGKI